MNNRLIILLAMACIMLSGKQKQQEVPEKNVIGKSEVKVENGQLSPEVLWAFGRIGNVDISPDGKKVLYTVTCYSIEENKSNAEIYTMNTDGSDVRRLTATSSSEWNVVWNPKGDKIGFLCADETGINMYEMNPDGSNKTQI
ncbi:MAG: peptidase S9, partial [Bacteroidales bacterium]|nr:peptidase S9 [Bacteroidales bacterium]